MTDAGGPSADFSAADFSTGVDYVALAPGCSVARYEILEVLGQGGFGITYRARDHRLGREVALKEYLPTALAVRRDGVTVLPRSTAVAGDFDWGRRRFIEEGRTLAGLHGAPSIVKVFDFLESNGTAYIVMELLRGETLDARLKGEGPLRPAEVEALLWPLLDGLQEVHEAGFLHRDIKPANVFLGAGNRPTLIDFGASRAAMAGRTQAMTAIFTPGYAAAEQFTSARQGPWTDIYGLAATLHCAVTGKPPPNAVDRLMDDRYEPLARRWLPGFPPGLLAGIDAALSIHADERPQTVAAWRHRLGQAPRPDEATLVMARPLAAPSAFPTPRPRRKGGWWIAGGAVLALLLLAGGYRALAPPLQTAAVKPAEDDARRALAESEAARRKAEAEAGQLKAAAARRQAEAADRKRLEDAAARQKAEADIEARRAAAAAPVAQPPAAPFDGSYSGSLTETANSLMGGGQLLVASLRVVGTSAVGQIDHPRCGASALSLSVSSSGEISGAVRMPDAMTCSLVGGTASGRVSGAGLVFELKGAGTVVRGMLAKGRSVPPAIVSAPQPQASPPATPAPLTVAAPAVGTFGGFYAGSLSTSKAGGGQADTRPLAAELHVSGNRLTGQLIHPTCGALPISLAIDSSGTIGGNVRLHEPVGCGLDAASATGKVSANALTLDIHGLTTSARGSLPRRAE